MEYKELEICFVSYYYISSTQNGAFNKYLLFYYAYIIYIMFTFIYLIYKNIEYKYIHITYNT